MGKSLVSCFFGLTVYIVCLFISYASPRIRLSSLFYLSFPLIIYPLRSQAGYHKRRLNLALVLCVFLCCSIFILIGECMLFVVSGFFVFPYQAKRLAWGNVFEWPILCIEWDVKPNSINQSIHHMASGMASAFVHHTSVCTCLAFSDSLFAVFF